MQIKIVGQVQLAGQLHKMANSFTSDVQKQMRTSMSQMHSDAEKGINTGSRSGNPYTKGGVTRVRSAPGELPKTDTGDLVSKFSTSVNRYPGKVVGTLRNTSDHAMALEFDSPTKGGRPFMRPLYKKWAPLLNIKFQAIMKESLRKNSK